MKARMMLGPAKDRERHLDVLARYLREGDLLVRSVDTYREGDATLHVPLDPAAEVVAVETPTLMPGGVTEIASYVVCRNTTRFRRVRVGDGPVDEADIDLRPVRVGQAS